MDKENKIKCVKQVGLKPHDYISGKTDYASLPLDRNFTEKQLDSYIIMWP